MQFIKGRRNMPMIKTRHNIISQQLETKTQRQPSYEVQKILPKGEILGGVMTSTSVTSFNELTGDSRGFGDQPFYLGLCIPSS
jgi:hypothetical protein